MLTRWIVSKVERGGGSDWHKYKANKRKSDDKEVYKTAQLTDLNCQSYTSWRNLKAEIIMINSLGKHLRSTNATKFFNITNLGNVYFIVFFLIK